MTNRYHATPYDIHASGFYFTTYEEFKSKAAEHRNALEEPVEEYEIQFIDGDNHTLFEAVGVNQANLEAWFDHWEDLGDSEQIQALALFEHGYSAEQVLEQYDEVSVFEGTVTEWAEEFIAGCYDLSTLPGNLAHYIDFEAFGRDCELEGSITTLVIHGTHYVLTL